MTSLSTKLEFKYGNYSLILSFYKRTSISLPERDLPKFSAVFPGFSDHSLRGFFSWHLNFISAALQRILLELNFFFQCSRMENAEYFDNNHLNFRIGVSMQISMIDIPRSSLGQN